MNQRPVQLIEPQVLEIGMADGAVRCGICGCSLAGETTVCRTCETPFHPDCWRYNGGCSIYGCAGRPGQSVPAERPPPPVVVVAPAPPPSLLPVVRGIFILMFGFVIGSFFVPQRAEQPRPAPPVVTFEPEVRACASTARLAPDSEGERRFWAR
jgi:hypothetical protein